MKEKANTQEVILNFLLQILINPWCASKAPNWRRIGKIMWITWNKFPFSKEIVPFFQYKINLSRLEQVTVVTTVLDQGGGRNLFYGMQLAVQKK